MVRLALTGLVLAACLTVLPACAGGTLSSGTPMDGSDKARCERDDMFWHANLGICEKI